MVTNPIFHDFAPVKAIIGASLRSLSTLLRTKLAIFFAFFRFSRIFPIF